MNDGGLVEEKQLDDFSKTKHAYLLVIIWKDHWKHVRFKWQEAHFWATFKKNLLSSTFINTYLIM